jgi:hypothetical protein
MVVSMSLTNQLKDPNSAVSRFMADRMRPDAVDSMIARFNAQITQRHPVVTDGVNADIVGVAFDYMFRWNVAPFEAQKLVAWNGARDMRDQRAILELVEMGNAKAEKRIASAIVLAWFERRFRSGHVRDELKRADPNTELPFVERLRREVPDADFADVQRLMVTVDQVWGNRLKEQPYYPNPQFAGSKDVGGADADWIMGRTLYECKTTRKSRPMDRQMFLQMIGYVLLDYADLYGIENVCWYFARHQLLLELPITNLFRDLSSLRAEFKKHLCPVTHSHVHLDRILDDIAWKHHGDEWEW